MLSILLFSCLLHPTYAISVQPSLTPCNAFSEPTCLREGYPASNCLELIEKIPQEEDARREYPWGTSPETLGKNENCEISVLRKVSLCPRFLLLNWFSDIQAVYDRCVVGGNRFGGFVFIGPNHAVPVLIANPRNYRTEAEMLSNVTRPACPVNNHGAIDPPIGIDRDGMSAVSWKGAYRPMKNLKGREVGRLKLRTYW